MKDYYRILGIERDASADEVKKAFRRLALQCHPDRNPGDKAAEDRFKEINDAYTCLNDHEKRANYDRFGTPEGPAFGPFQGGFGDIFENIFGDFFGTFAGGKTRATRGTDLRYDLDVTFEEAAFGTEKTIEVPRFEACGQCGGSGSSGKGPVVCTDCKGSGQVRFQKGFFTIAQTCRKCRGQGRLITDPCGVCHGQGKIRVLRKVRVGIPPGVDEGMRLKLQREGEAGLYGGPPGDLYVVVGLKGHAFFRRDGTNIFCEVPMSFIQAVLGAELGVPTLDGPQRLKIPPGTQPGETFRLKGAGFPRVGSRMRGDQIVSVTITVPRRLTEKQKELIEEFERLSGEESSRKGIKGRLKDIFTGSGAA